MTDNKVNWYSQAYPNLIIKLSEFFSQIGFCNSISIPIGFFLKLVY